MGCVDKIFTLKQIDKKAPEEKSWVFMDLENAYDRFNMEPYDRLKMYDVGGKLLNGIQSMCVNSLVCKCKKW